MIQTIYPLNQISFLWVTALSSILSIISGHRLLASLAFLCLLVKELRCKLIIHSVSCLILEPSCVFLSYVMVWLLFML